MSGEAESPSDVVEFELGDLTLDGGSVEEGPARRVERTRSLVAFSILALIAAVMAAMMTLLYQEKISVEEFSAVGGTLLSPLTGLLGAATGYYYGRRH